MMNGMRLMTRGGTIFVLALALCASLTACGGDEPSAFPNAERAASTSTPERGAATPNSTSEDSDGGIRVETPRESSPDDILLSLPRQADIVRYIDFQGDAPIESMTKWNELNGVLFEELGIDFAGLDYIAYGEYGDEYEDGESALLLLGGVDAGGLRDTLADLEFGAFDMGGLKVWVGSFPESGRAMAIFLGEDTVLLGTHTGWDAEPSRFIQQLVSRLSRGYPMADDLLRDIASQEADLENAVKLIAGKPGVTLAILAYLSDTVESEFDDHAAFIEWIRGDLTVQIAREFADEEDADDLFSEWVDGNLAASIVIADHLASNKDTAEDFVRWLAGDEDTIQSYARSLAEQERGSFVNRDGDPETYAAVGPWGREMHLPLGPASLDEALNMMWPWLEDGDEQAMAHVWPAIGEETREIVKGILTRMKEDAVSLYDAAGDSWGSMPGFFKKLVICGPSSDDGCVFSLQSMSKASDQEFRWAGFFQFETADQAAEVLEEVEDYHIHDSCDSATFEQDGNRIKGEAVCGVEVLADLW